MGRPFRVLVEAMLVGVYHSPSMRSLFSKKSSKDVKDCKDSKDKDLPGWLLFSVFRVLAFLVVLYVLWFRGRKRGLRVGEDTMEPIAMKSPLPASRFRSRTVATALLLLALLPGAVLAQQKELHWSELAVRARLDSTGVLHVEERQAMVFTGDWNGDRKSVV